MAFKIVFVLAALLACAYAKPGGPAAYSISAPSIDHGSVGQSQEHTVKGHYGQNSQSDYSSQVKTAHSQSHVQRSSISNDAGYAAPGHVVAAAPVAHGISAPAVYAHAAPSISHGITLAQAAPAIQYAHSAPSYSYGGLALGGYSHGLNYAAAAPALTHGISYASAPVYSHGGYAHGISHAYTAPAAIQQSYVASAPAAIKYSAAPAYGRLTSAAHGAVLAGHGALLGGPGALLGGHGALLGGHGALLAPGLGLSAHYAAPALVKAAPALVHTSVAGHGVHYGY